MRSGGPRRRGHLKTEEAEEGEEKKEEAMGEEEEEVLGYLDRVLEEEMIECGDGDPITVTHRHWKVRQRPDSWVQDKPACMLLEVELLAWCVLQKCVQQAQPKNTATLLLLCKRG